MGAPAAASLRPEPSALPDGEHLSARPIWLQARAHHQRSPGPHNLPEAVSTRWRQTSCIRQRQKPTAVCALIPRLPVESFDVGVPGRLARRDEVLLDAVFEGALVRHPADELRPMTHLGRLRAEGW